MGKVYVLREPRRGDKAWNIYALREAARLKKWFQGVYYSPRLKRLLAVFKPTPDTHVNLEVFEELNEGVLKDAFRMECPRGCNRCCVFRSGAFILENELRELPSDIAEKIMKQPSELIKTPGGWVRVYRLDTEPMGRCIFFDVEKGECMLEALGGKKFKPIVCLLTYCTVFATKNGEKYLKTGFRVLPDGKVEMHYKRVSDDEWNIMVRRMASTWLRYRKVYRSLKEAESKTSL